MALAALGRYTALDHHFEVEVEEAQAAYLARVLEGLADPEATPDTAYRLCGDEEDDRFAALYDGDEIASTGRPQLLAQILVNIIDRRTTTGLRVGGATVSSDGGGTVVLAGNAAETATLATRLLLDGASLVSGGLSAVDADTGVVRAFHRPLKLDRVAFDRLGIVPPPGIDPCGCGGALLVTVSQLGCRLAAASRPTVLAHLDPGLETLERVSAASMLARLLDTGALAMGERARDLGTLAELVAGTTCVVVGTADLAVAAGWITELLGRHRPDPLPTLVEEHDGRLDVFVGPEAVIVERGPSGIHHLNSTAAAVWLLRTDGLRPRAIAAELRVDRGLVDDALRLLSDAGLG